MKCDRVTPKRHWTCYGAMAAAAGWEIERVLRGTSVDQFIRDGYNKQRRRIERRAKSPA